MTRFQIVVLLVALSAASAGCSSLTPFYGPSSLEFVSNTTGAAVEPALVLRVYKSEDSNTADIYMTDLPELADPSVTSDALAHATGHLIAIHLFIVPKAGKTPIAYTAADMTITHIILADGAVGVYRGAGFLLPSGSPGGTTFGGKTSQATLRPMSATSGFNDLLNWNEARGHVSAMRDEETARALDARIATVLLRTDLVEINEPD